MNDYSHGSSRGSDPFLKKLRRRRLIAGSLVFIGVGVALAGAGIAFAAIAAKRAAPKASQESILALWSAKDYAGVSSACDVSLELAPLDPFYLVFKGFSAFYLGLSESDGEKRGARMDEAIFSIRKALIDPDSPLRPESAYILGKAYFHKGPDYYNEAISYLVESTELGYSQADTWEYLAIAAYRADRIEQSIAAFDKAMSLKPGSPELMLSAAMANARADRTERAEALANEALSSTGDEYLAERCGFLLGELYLRSGRLEEALAKYQDIQAKNPESAEAWFQQGLVLIAAGDPIRARAAWRKAIAIDPMHAGARQKLSERS